MKKVLVSVVCCVFAGAVSAAVVQVDLSELFDRDTVLAPGEPLVGASGDFDGLDADIGAGYALVAEGWDGYQDNPAASGPPEDGVVADYQLGPLDGLNAINLSTDDVGIPVEILVPAGRYSQVRFLVSAGDGDCNIPITFYYATGDPVEALLMADDWFDDYPDLDAGGPLRTDLATVVNGWDRFQLPSTFVDANDPGLFAHTMALDSTRDLAAIELRPGDPGTWWERPAQASPTALNLFAINLDTARNVPPDAVVTSDPSDPAELVVGVTPLDVTLTCTAADADGGPMALTYSWGLTSAPAGSVVVFTPPLPVTAPEVLVTLDILGTYVFTCRVTDGADTVEASIALTTRCPNDPPEISLTLSGTVVAPGGQITADASATVDPDGGPSPLAFSWELVMGPLTRIDLAEHFNADGVFEPGGDYNASTIDGGGMEFLVEGFDGINEGQANVQGLPPDGMLGEFQLGPYDGLNIIQLHNASPDVTIEVGGQDDGASLVYLVTSGSGDSAVFVEIGYSDGSTSEGTIYADDWFDDAADGTLQADFLTPVIDGLDRATAAGGLEDSNDPAIFRGAVELEPAPIETITLRPMDARSVFGSASTRFNLFGLWVAAGGVAIESPSAAMTAITLGDVRGDYRFRLIADDGDLCTGPQAKEFVITVEGAAAELFKRGDVNVDNRLDIADAIALLGHLFSGKPMPDCPDAADGNDDGKLDIADAIRILGHLFASTGPLPAPFGACGEDQTDDKLPACAFAPCGG